MTNGSGLPRRKTLELVKKGTIIIHATKMACNGERIHLVLAYCDTGAAISKLAPIIASATRPALLRMATSIFSAISG